MSARGLLVMSLLSGREKPHYLVAGFWLLQTVVWPFVWPKGVSCFCRMHTNVKNTKDMQNKISLPVFHVLDIFFTFHVSGMWVLNRRNGSIKQPIERHLCKWCGNCCLWHSSVQFIPSFSLQKMYSYIGSIAKQHKDVSNDKPLNVRRLSGTGRKLKELSADLRWWW